MRSRAGAVFLACFALGTWALARVIEGIRRLAAAPEVETAAGLLVSAALLFGCLWGLGLFVYQAERDAGRLKRRVRSYEAFLARRQRA